MKILVIGAAGVIGMHTSLKLSLEGHKVIGIDNINSYYNVNQFFEKSTELEY